MHRNFSAPDPSFGVLLGTDLKPGSFQTVFDKINETATQKLVLTDVGGVKVGQKDNVTFGQLNDGVIAIADTSNTFMTLIPSADNVAKFKLDTSKAISLFVSSAVLKKLDKPGSKGNEFVTGINEVTGYLDMVTNKAVFRAACKSEEEAKKLQGIANVLSTSDDMKQKAAGAPMGAGEILKSMTARIEGKDVIIDLTIPSSSIDEAAKLLSQELDKALKGM